MGMSDPNSPSLSGSYADVLRQNVGDVVVPISQVTGQDVVVPDVGVFGGGPLQPPYYVYLADGTVQTVN